MDKNHLSTQLQALIDAVAAARPAIDVLTDEDAPVRQQLYDLLASMDDLQSLSDQPYPPRRQQNGQLEATNQALRESEARLKALIANLPGAAAFVVDHDLRYTLAEGEALYAAGFQPDDLVGKTIYEALDAATAASYEPSFRRALAGEPYLHEHDDYGRSFVSRGVPLRDEHGEIYSVLAVSYDVTNDKRAEEALRESEERYHRLFNSIDEGFCVIEVQFDDNDQPVDYRFLQTNPAFKGQTGLVDAVGKSVRALVPDLEQHWFETYGRVAHTGKPERFINKAEDLGNRWFDVYAFPIPQAENQVGVLFKDISEQKRMEMALRASEAQQAFLLKLSDALRPLADPVEMQVTATRILGEALGVSRALYVEFDADAEYFTIERDYHVPEAPILLRRYRLDDFGLPMVAELRAGCTLAVADVRQEDRLTPRDQSIYAPMSIVGHITVPLVKNGRLVALLSIHSPQPREWTEAEIVLMEETAARTWAALEQARAEAAMRVSEEKYRTLFENMDEGYILVDVIFDEQDKPVDIRYVDANPAAVRVTGTELVGHTTRELDPNYEQHWFETFGRVAKTGVGERHEFSAAPLVVWYNFYVFKVGDPESRRVAAVYQDITQSKRIEAALRASEERQAFLLKLSDALRPLANPIEIQAEASRVLGEHLSGSRVAYAEIRGDEAMVHVDYVNGVESMIGRYQKDSFGPKIAAAYQSGKTVIISDTAADAQFNEIERAAYAAANVAAYVGLPLIKGGTWVAVFAISTDQPRVWTDDEVALIQETAERTWDAVERARAEMQLRKQEEQQAFLLKLSDALRPLADPIAIQGEAARVLGEHLKVNRVAYVEIIGEDAIVHLDYVNGVTSIVGRYRADDFGMSVTSAFRSGKTLAVEDVNTYADFNETERAIYAALSIRAYVGIPLIKQGAWVALVGIYSTEARIWTGDEITLTQQTAERTWDAVERARAEAAAAQQERRTAEILENIGDIFYALDEDYRFTYLNRRAEEAWGRSRQDLLGRHMWTLFPEAVDNESYQYHVQVMNERQAIHFETISPILKQWIEVSIYPSESGGLAVYFHDITDRKRVELDERRQRMLAEALRDAASNLSGTLELSKVLEEGMLSARRLLDYAAAYIVLTEDDVLTQFQSNGLPDAQAEALEHWHRQFAILDDAPIYSVTADNEQIAMINDQHQAEELLPITPLYSLSVIPLVREQDTLGYLVLLNGEPNERPKPDIMTLQAFSYQLVAAISNARLFVQAQELAALQQRQQLARDLHDAVSQTLFTASIMLESLLLRQERGSNPRVPNLLDIHRLIKGAQAEMRTLLMELRPSNVQSTPLSGLLRQLVDAVKGRKRIEITLEFISEPVLPSHVHVAIYRIAQEALNNLTKHANAKEAWVIGSGGEGYIELRVRDNGTGFDMTQPKAGLGLQIMRERAAEIDAALDIQSRVGEGTEVHLRWPKPSDDPNIA